MYNTTLVPKIIGLYLNIRHSA